MNPAFAKITLVMSLAAAVAVPASATDMLLEEQWARQQEAHIIEAPIAGIQNRFWFEYRREILDAQQELAEDLRRADDIEDVREAWEEYGEELIDEREDYVEEMAERGYRMWDDASAK